jgi:hypothetical protein
MRRDGERRNFGAMAKVCILWVEFACTAMSRVRVNAAMELREIEPNTGLTLAAIDGLFSTKYIRWYRLSSFSQINNRILHHSMPV